MVLSSNLPEDILGQMLFLLKEYHEFYLLGIRNTLIIALIGTIFGTLFGMGLALLRNLEIYPRDIFILRFTKLIIIRLTILYIDIVRGTPMMVQAMIFYFGIAAKVMDPLTAGIIIVSFNSAAYIAEIIRSGINAISTGQLEAARSLGLTRMQAMKKVVIPQALTNSVPALMNELIVNIKDSSVLSVIGVADLFYMSKAAASEYYWNVPAFLLAAVFYFILTISLAKLFEYIAKRMKKQHQFPQSQTVPEVI